MGLPQKIKAISEEAPGQRNWPHFRHVAIFVILR